MKVGNRKFCCIAKSKLAKLLRPVRQMKEGARRSKEQMTEKGGAEILDEEKQQGRQDSGKLPVLSPPEPPLPPQPRPLWEQIEEQIEGMNKRNRELAGRMHAQGGARGGERPEGQGNGEPPAPPAMPPSPQSSSLLEQLEQVWESVKHTNKRLEEHLRWSGQRQQGERGKQWAPTPLPLQQTQRLRRGIGARCRHRQCCRYGQCRHCGWHHHRWGHRRHGGRNLRGDHRRQSRRRCNQLPHHQAPLTQSPS